MTTVYAIGVAAFEAGLLLAIGAARGYGANYKQERGENEDRSDV
jgi:hypothetical protein